MDKEKGGDLHLLGCVVGWRVGCDEGCLVGYGLKCEREREREREKEQQMQDR